MLSIGIEKNMRKAKFSIDLIDGFTFDGYTQGEEWNGFACPYFNFEQAVYLKDVFSKVGVNASYNQNKDLFIFVINMETESYFPVNIEGNKYYPIGAFNWIWDEHSALFSD
jgi:hypothetical protein